MNNGLRLQFHSPPPLTVTPPDWLRCSPSQLPEIRLFVSLLLSRGKIRKAFHQPLFFSRLFLVPKKGGSLRLIIDLSRLNKFLIVPRFRMESVWDIAAGLILGLWGCTVDLEDAYHSVPVCLQGSPYSSGCLLSGGCQGLVGCGLPGSFCPHVSAPAGPAAYDGRIPLRWR